MAKLFKRGQASGKPSGKWMYSIRLADGRWSTRTGYASKAETQALAQRKQIEEDKKRDGTYDPFAAAKVETLAKHVEAYRRSLADDSEKHVRLTLARLNTILAEAPFVLLSDLTAYDAPDKVLRVLAELKTKPKSAKSKHVPKPLSAQSRGYYLQAIRGFVRWAARERRIPHSPIADMKRPTSEPEVLRRPLTEDEFSVLIEAATNGPTVSGLTGEARAALYVTAAATGFRAQELASLKSASFRDDCIALVGKSAKNRKTVDQPIAVEALELVRPYVDQQDGKVWPGRWWEKAAKMLRHDLAAAGIEFETDEGKADFHSLRMYFITSLAKTGCHPELARQLARHSKLELTMQTYTKLGDAAKREALAKLPVPRSGGAGKNRQNGSVGEQEASAAVSG